MKVLSDILHKAGILKENAESYSSGGYSVFVRNSTTQRVETVPSSSLVPNQSGNGGKYLTTDGSNLSWGTVSTANIYNSDGTLTGNRTLTQSTFSLTFAGSTSTRFHSTGNVTIGGTTDAGYKLDVQGTGRFTGNLTISNAGLYVTSPNGYSGGAIEVQNNMVGASAIQIKRADITNAMGVLQFSDLKTGASGRAFTIGIGRSGDPQWTNGDFIFAFYKGSGGWEQNAKIFNATGNWAIENGSATSDIASALLQVNSTTKGFLPPRMTTAQRDLIGTPATGLSIYNTTLNTNDFYNGTAWVSQAAGNIYTASGSLTSARALTLNAFNLDFIGSTHTNRITAAGRLLLGTTTESTYILDVNGTARIANTLTVTKGASNYITLEASANATSPFIDIFYSGNSQARIYPSVGRAVGTLTLSQGVSINQNSTTIDAGLYASNIGILNGQLGITNTSGNSLIHLNTSAGFSTFISFRETAVADKGVIGFSNGQTYFQIRTNGATNLTNGTLNAAFFATGNTTLGGTTDAGYKLDVQGTGRFTGNIYMLNDNGIVFNDNASTGRRFAITQDASVITNTGVESISIGYASYAYSLWSVALGTRVGIPSGYNSVVAVGYNFTVPGKGIYLQRNSFGLRMGSSATDRDIALGGYVNTGDVEGGTALGAGTSVSGGYGVAIGVWSVAGGQEFVAGASDGAGTAKPISNVYFGSGKIRGKGDGTATVTYTDGAGSSYTINGSGAYGTDFAGGNITIAGGKGTGTGTPGDVIFSTATALTTGTTLQSLTQRVWIKGGTGNLLVGSSTDGGQRFQVSGNAQVTHSYTHTTGSYTSGLTSYVLASTALSPSYTSGMFYGALNTSYQNEFEGSATIPNSVTMSSQLNRTTVKFVNANSTITMTQGGSGLRAIANQILQFSFDTAQTSCVVSHVAGSQILAPYYTGANNPTITNYYGLAINPSDEYSATLAVTNRWGVYQMGTSDNNWFAGKVIIGSTNTVGSSNLNVKNLPTSSAGLSSGDVWNDGGTLKIV